MTWILLATLIGVLLLAVSIAFERRAELKSLARSISTRQEAKERGSHKARLQYPAIDLTRCIGCGLCVDACPEEEVLGLIHGQAVVVHGGRCVGHGRCADACPVGAIALTLADLKDRRDIPAINEELEVKGVPGLFLAGELTGYALVRTAIAHGTAVADEVAQRVSRNGVPRHGATPGGGGEPLDLCIVGAGPAGLACSLEARSRGMRFVTLEQEALGGTVAQYPRRKLVLTQPVELPLHGSLKKSSYYKEELVELWQGIARTHRLPVRTGIEVTSLEREPEGAFRVRTKEGMVRARYVCLALGRRGTPRKLGVPGEDLPKVAYSLLDACSYSGRRVLVVGGGDSAVEAAIGLAEQPGNKVTLSYRKPAFFRLKARNEAQLKSAIGRGLLDVVVESKVERIEEGRVQLGVKGPDGKTAPRVIPNDDVFIMAGGIPPFRILEEAGVSFSPEDRAAPPPVAEQGRGLLLALATALTLALGVLGWALHHAEYYRLAPALRAGSPLHEGLRSAGPFGVAAGIAACALMLFNISYLIRRARIGRRLPGSLKAWMTGHLVTGILALLFVLLHSALAPRATVGGHALIALSIVVAAGAVGRYFYAFVPHAANGRELELDEVKARLASLSGEWDRSGRGFGERVREQVHGLVETSRWQTSFFRRLLALLTQQRHLRQALGRLRVAGREEGIPDDQMHRLLSLARQAHRTALMAAHFEELRGLLASWRYLHRWLALLMFLLATVHIVTAVRYADLRWPELSTLFGVVMGGVQ